MIYKDTGIIIKQREYSDYDRIITVITKHHGKVVAIAKGVRRLTSKKSASTDILVKSSFSFAEGKSLDIVTEAVLDNSYENSKTNYENVTSLFKIAQIIDQLVVEGDNLDSSVIYDLFAQTLDIINKKTLDDDSRSILIIAFELKLLSILGILPDFYHCNNCGLDLRSSNSFLFRSSVGGIICDKCSEKQNGNLSESEIKSLRYLSENNISKSILLKCNAQIIKSLDMVCQGMLSYFTDLHLPQ